MARRYSDKSIMSLDSSDSIMPMDNKESKMGNMPLNSGMAIASSWDSLEGMDQETKKALKSFTSKRK